MPITTDDLRDYLRDNPGQSCTEIGEHFWGGTSLRLRQSYARPAGRLVNRAVIEGKVHERSEEIQYYTRNRSKVWYRRLFYATKNEAETEALK